MEEEKAAAYYDELTRKGEGAARFKQGLGFSSTRNDSAPPPPRGSALSSSSSLFSSFVKASSPTEASKIEKQSQLETIQNKLKKKPKDYKEPSSRFSDRSEREAKQRHRSRSRERERDRHRRHRSRSKDSERDKDRERTRRRRRSRSRSRSRSISPRRDRRRERRSRSRSSSPRDRRRSDRRSDTLEKERRGKDTKHSVDYSLSIPGYDKMTAAEKVRARMKLQLSETAEKDTTKGMGSGWERFEFNKDAPLDDEEIEAADDDATMVKHLGQSFRFKAVEARREERIKAAHDEAIFGPSTVQRAASPETVPDTCKKDDGDAGAISSLLSDKVLAKQQGSWRDRARKL